jgi:hypothetical protein
MATALAISTKSSVPPFPATNPAFPIPTFQPNRSARPTRASATAIPGPRSNPFVSAELAERGLHPRPGAAPETLLRRVHLDLIGLAPTPAERAEFLKDPSTENYARIVDQLLARPEHGERWGRHWMDIWRYSDWAGYKDALRDSQRHIWHWRDWIVESLNADKPYDRMLLEMLAGDELDPENEDALRGTGYLARHFFAERDQWMDNIVKHTSQGFLGITLGCAKCHDHMYDPFPQEDYYALRAVFEPYNVRTDRLPGELDILRNGLPRAFDRTLDSKTYVFDRGDERRPEKDRVIAPGVPPSLGGSYSVEPVTLPSRAQTPAKRKFVINDLLANAGKALSEAKEPKAKEAARLQLAALEAELAVEQLEDGGDKKSDIWKTAALKAAKLQRDAALASARFKLAAAELAELKASKAKAGASLTAAKKKTAAARKESIAAEKALKEPLTTKFARRKIDTYPGTSSGRRLAFARWLTHRENPLSARVAMNQIWLRHIGQAIVPTVTEFGANGREPTHPALLDWLAAEFMDKGWSMKQMHRLIVTSDTYRRAGTSDAENSKTDPDNVWLWRMPTRRMEGEIVRDNLLHIAGTLDRTLGGPDIDHQQAETSKRRSIYLRHAHEKLVEFIQIFDGPKVSECYSREESIQPHQALALANSRLTHDQAVHLAARLPTQAGPFIQAACEAILSRAAKPEEIRLCTDFLTDNPADGRARLVNILFNHNDFVTIR